MTNILIFLLFEDSRIGQFIEIKVESKLTGDGGNYYLIHTAFLFEKIKNSGNI